MQCPKCKSENVTVELAQAGGRTKKHGVGIGGHINNAARKAAAMGTLGFSNLVWKKSTGTEKTTFKNEAMCVCQNCGHVWKVK